MQTRGGENQEFPVSTREKKKKIFEKPGGGKAVTGLHRTFHTCKRYDRPTYTTYVHRCIEEDILGL